MIELISSLIEIVQSNFVGIFLIVLCSTLIIKITSYVIKSILGILLLILILKIMFDMGIIYIPFMF